MSYQPLLPPPAPRDRSSDVRHAAVDAEMRAVVEFVMEESRADQREFERRSLRLLRDRQDQDLQRQMEEIRKADDHYRVLRFTLALQFVVLALLALKEWAPLGTNGLTSILPYLWDSSAIGWQMPAAIAVGAMLMIAHVLGLIEFEPLGQSDDD